MEAAQKPVFPPCPRPVLKAPEESNWSPLCPSGPETHQGKEGGGNCPRGTSEQATLIPCPLREVRPLDSLADVVTSSSSQSHSLKVFLGRCAPWGCPGSLIITGLAGVWGRPLQPQEPQLPGSAQETEHLLEKEADSPRDLGQLPLLCAQPAHVQRFLQSPTWCEGASSAPTLLPPLCRPDGKEAFLWLE